MRYSVHPSRAFRNRIVRNLGVLVAAALIASPGAAECRTGPNHRRRPASYSPIMTLMLASTATWGTSLGHQRR